MKSKRVYPDVWLNGEPGCQLLKVHSKGTDKGQMQKIASDSDFGRDIRPEKGCSFLHIITLGCGEKYGPNTRADYFNKEACDFVLPHPKGSVKVLKLAGGLKEYHPTFMKYAAVYRNHENSRKKGKKYGEVIDQRYNDIMDRGELIVKVPDSEWLASLEKLASGQQISWSMGCGVPEDYCSYCGNAAPDRKQICSHIRRQPLQIDTDGHQIFAINDRPHFHDISEVPRAADRIALTLEKVASDGQAFVADDEGLYLPLHVVKEIGGRLEKERAGLLEKLAQMEKQIPVEVCGASTGLPDIASDDLHSKDLESLMEYPLEDVLLAMSKNQCILGPEDFIRLILRKKDGDIPGLHAMPCALRSMFSDIGPSEEILTDSSYEPKSSGSWGSLDDKVKTLIPELSLADEPVRRRVTIRVVVGPKAGKEKKASSLEPSAEAKVLAKEYAKYQLSFLTYGDNAKFSDRIVLANSTR